MDLDELASQLDSMNDRFMRLSPSHGMEPSNLRSLWEETSEALGVTVEELRVAVEELRHQNIELEESRRAIEEERRRYQELFDFAPDGYLVTDLYGLIREANRAAGELLGTSPYHLSGKPFPNYIVMEDRIPFRGGLNRLKKAGRRDEWVVRIQPRRGPAYVGSITAAVIRDPDGTPTGLRWLIREVKAPASGVDEVGGRVTIGLPGEWNERSGRLRAEDEAEALRELLQGVEMIVWEADAETGRYGFVSPRAQQVLGYSTERWIEEPGFWSEIVHGDDRPLVEAQRARCVRDGRGGELEYRLIAADGRVLWFRESISVVADEEGRPRLLRGCLWEIGRRKKVERQLYTDRRKLAEHLSDVWHLYLLGGQLLAAIEIRPMLEEILSATASLLGAEMGLIRLLDPERGELEATASLGLSADYLHRFGRIPQEDPACGLAARRGEPVTIGDIETDPGAEGWIERSRAGGFRAAFIVPIVNRRGELLGTIATFFREPHRPTERHLHLVEQYVLQAADALDAACRYQEVRDSDRRKEEFLATLAHELRNALATIQTSAFLLEPDAILAGSGLVGEARELIIRQVRHMTKLVEDLLDVTRVSRGKLALRKQPVTLADVVTRTVANVRSQIEARRHELLVSIPEEPIVLDADPTRLEQILANLLTNASKFTDPGGRIELIATREGDDAVIRLRDTGIGLAPEELAGLFRLYNQVGADEERSRNGLGIGLALVKSLVELHGGEVWAASDGPHCGSEFTVRLPIGP